MKHILLFITLFTFTLQTKTQEVSKTIFDQAANQDILYGICTANDFLKPPFDSWYIPEHDSYSPDSLAIKTLIDPLKDVHIRVVLGTWCGDSQREVPRFIQILETVNFPMNMLEIICVNRAKTAIEVGVETGYIEFVPTFIISKNGVELGRIIESPTESLEKDLLGILQGK